MRNKNSKLLLTAILIICVLFSLIFTGCAQNQDSGIDDDAEPVYILPQRFTQVADRSPRNGVKREWNKVSSYFINYGRFQNEMLYYDVAIVNPAALTEEDVDKLTDAGVWKIGYLSIGADDEANVADGMGPNGKASYYFYEGGSPVQDIQTGKYYVDASNAIWRKIIINKATEIIEKGYDGLYLDNLDTVEVYPQSANGMNGLIKLLSQTFPDVKLVANRGFSILPTYHQFIDGLVFENFYTYLDTRYNESRIYSEEDDGYKQNLLTAVEVVNAIRQEHNFPVFSLDYFEEVHISVMLQAIYDFAWKFDFIPYVPLGGRSLTGGVTGHRLIPVSARGSLSIVDPGVPKPVLNGDVSAANLAYVGNGGIVTVDSSYPGYGPAALNDGYIGNEANIDVMHWSKVCWASAENENPHWIQIETKSAVVVTKIVIEWALDGGIYYSSQNVIIEAFIDGAWTEIGRAEDLDFGIPTTAIDLDCPQTVTKVRIYQPASNGPIVRPNLLWVSEVSLYA